MRAALGIDTGSRGCACVIPKDRSTIHIYRFMHGEYQDWCDFISEMAVMYMIKETELEYVATRPKDGKATMFTFGRNDGVILGCLHTNHIRYRRSHSTKWQTGTGVGGHRAPPGCTNTQEASAKQRAYQAKAQKIVLAIGSDFKVTQDAGAGILIAEYNWKLLFGGLK